MNKIFKVEEGNVLRLVMDEPKFDDKLVNNAWAIMVCNEAIRAYNNRESYPYVADWKVGDLKEEGVDFELKRERQILFHTEKQWYKMSSEEKDACFEYTATPISKPKKED